MRRPSAIDLVAVGFAAAIAALTGIVFGLAPALRLTRVRSSNVLVPASRTVTGGHERFRAALVVVEIALALVLLTGAGLMMKSFLRLRAVDSGFRADNVIRMSVELPRASYPTADQLQTFHSGMLDGLRAVPGAAAAGLINWLPLGDMYLQGDFAIEGQASPQFNIGKTAVSGGYFRAMGIRLLRGREFDDRDTATSQPVVIVSRNGRNAIDRSGDDAGKAGQRVGSRGRAQVADGGRRRR